MTLEKQALVSVIKVLFCCITKSQGVYLQISFHNCNQVSDRMQELKINSVLKKQTEKQKV